MTDGIELGKNFRSAVAVALLASTGVATAALSPAMAQSSANIGQRRIAIPAQSLTDAIILFGRQSGIEVTAGSDLLDGKISSAVEGSLTPAEALSRLLTGTGLTFRFIGSRSVELQAAPQATAGSIQLGPVRVEGGAQATGTAAVLTSDPAASEGSGSYAARLSSTATALPLTARELPQSVTTVTRQRMDDQAVTSIGEALRTTTGVSVQNYDSDRLSFWSRGYSIGNVQQDGVSAVYDGVFDWGSTQTDTAIYDRIEVVKGATGLLSGAGEPGAVVNMIRKRPTGTLQASVTAMVGSWSNYRGEIDVSGPLTEGGAVRGRFVAAVQDRKSWLDRYHQSKSVFFGTLEADLTPTTLVTVGMDYQNFKPRGSTWTGFPMMFADGTPTNWSRSFNPATDWSRRDIKTRTVFGRVEQALGDDWSLKVNFNGMRTIHDTVLGSASGGNPDSVTGEGMYYFIGKFAGDQIQNTIDAEVRGTVHALGREHQIVVGYRWSRSDIDGPLYGSVYPAFEGSIYDWKGVYAEPDIPQVGTYRNGTRQSGVYAAAHLNPVEGVRLILGSRLSQYRVFTNNYYTDTATTNVNVSYKEKNVWTPYAGAVVDVTGNVSLYASYTDIFQIQQSVDRNFNLLPPMKGRSYEAGVKGEWLDGRLNASAAVFDIRQSNLAQYRGLVNGIQVYDVVAGTRSRGFELEVNGSPLPGWNVYGGYTYSHVRDGDGQPVFGSLLQTTLPAHVAKLHVSYKPEGLDRLTLGGGIDWQSRFFGNVYSPVPDVGYVRFTQGGYALADIFAEYRLTDQITARVNVRNLFDKKYYTGLGLFETGFYGEPRSALATLKATF